LDRIWLAPPRGLSGESEEFVDESHFVCDPGFDQDAMAAPDPPADSKGGSLKLKRNIDPLEPLGFVCEPW
jgi:hypothetical protein